MRGRIWFAAAIGWAVVFGVVAVWARAQGIEEGELAASRFDAKTIVAVNLSSNLEAGAVLSGVEVRRLGNQSFLVGRGVETGVGHKGFQGRVTWVAIRDISLITEFPDVKTYREMIEATGGSAVPTDDSRRI
ncbi:MAG: hypothetical protein JW888_05480 [Pirellulales bacterium]|nr:hypothetical protein [Pirellulales bacterium]